MGKRITYNLKFIDSFRFMWTSLSSLVDNFCEIYSKQCRDKKNASLSVILLGIKIINYIINAANVKQDN